MNSCLWLLLEPWLLWCGDPRGSDILSESSSLIGILDQLTGRGVANFGISESIDYLTFGDASEAYCLNLEYVGLRGIFYVELWMILALLSKFLTIGSSYRWNFWRTLFLSLKYNS